MTGQIFTSWLLLSWFAAPLINAVADRGVSGIGRDTTGLRLRSLRPIALWVVLLGNCVALRLRLKSYVIDTQSEKACETDVTRRALEVIAERGIQPPGCSTATRRSCR